MASKNITRKIAALAELNRDPALAIETAWTSIEEAAQNADVHGADLHLIGQIIKAVTADIRFDAKKESDA